MILEGSFHTSLGMAVVFDLGGVVVTSPFGFIRSFEERNSLPVGVFTRLILRGELNNDGSFQRLEGGTLTPQEFCVDMERLLLEQEGVRVDMRAWLQCLEQSFKLRQHFVDAMNVIRERGLLIGVITNNWPNTFAQLDMQWLGKTAHVVVESYRESKG